MRLMTHIGYASMPSWHALPVPVVPGSGEIELIMISVDDGECKYHRILVLSDQTDHIAEYNTVFAVAWPR